MFVFSFSLYCFNLIDTVKRNMVNYQIFMTFILGGNLTMFRVLVSDKMSNDGLLPLLESDFVEIVQKM